MIEFNANEFQIKIPWFDSGRQYQLEFNETKKNQNATYLLYVQNEWQLFGLHFSNHAHFFPGRIFFLPKFHCHFISEVSFMIICFKENISTKKKI